MQLEQESFSTNPRNNSSEVGSLVKAKPNTVAVGYISPTSGKIKRFKITSSSLLAVICVVIVFMAGFGFVTGGYARAQVERLRNFVLAEKLGTELNILEQDNKNLKFQIDSLSSSNNRVKDLEEDVRTQLAQLKDIMSSAAQLGVLPNKNGSNEAKASNGLGGAELDCLMQGQKCISKRNTNKSDSANSDLIYGYQPSSFSRSVDNYKFDAQLLNELNYYKRALQVVPVGSPVAAPIYSHFGPRLSPFSKKVRHHQGVDFSMPHGSKIRCTADGVVLAVKRDSVYGILVDVKHSDHVVTRYAHLSKSLVVKGQKVTRGFIIGQVGSTGRSTGPHLHYEVRVKDRAVNPITLINMSKRIAGVV